MVRLWVGLGVILLAAACTPKVIEVGPPISTPFIADDAFVTADGARLALQSWQADSPKAIVIGLHGMNDYAKTFEMPGPWMAERGITSYAYDQRGFGRSPGKGIWPGSDTLRADAVAFVRAVRKRHSDLPIYLMGVSMGAAVALSALAEQESLDVSGLILVAPAVWGWSTLNPLYKTTLWLTAHTFPAWTLTGSGLKIQPSDNIEMLRDNYYDDNVIKGTRTDAIYGLVGLMDDGYFAVDQLDLPILLLYGEKDEIIPRDPLESVVARLPEDNRVALYKEGYHMLLRDLQRETVWADIEAWILDPDAPFPSGQEWTLEEARSNQLF